MIYKSRETSFLIIAILFMSTCSREHVSIYPNDHTRSTLTGLPVGDSLRAFFPLTIRRDTSTVETLLDTNELGMYAAVLYAANEPVLHNFYIGHDIYRCVWFPSFMARRAPIVTSLHRSGDQVWITTKTLDTLPWFELHKFGHFRGWQPVPLIEAELPKVKRPSPISFESGTI